MTELLKSHSALHSTCTTFFYLKTDIFFWKVTAWKAFLVCDITAYSNS